jgi:hypothetical protein
VKENFNELGCTFEGAMDGILSKFQYGFSFTEKVWAERDNMLALADLKTRHPYGIEFFQDAYGNILKIAARRRRNPRGMSLPIEKFLHCVHDQQFSNPYGNQRPRERLSPVVDQGKLLQVDGDAAREDGHPADLHQLRLERHQGPTSPT